MTKFSYANWRYACAARPLNDVFRWSVCAYTDHTCVKTQPCLVCGARHSCTNTFQQPLWKDLIHVVARGACTPPLRPSASHVVMNSATSELNFLPCKQWRENCCPEHTHPFSTLFITSCVQTHARIRLEIARTIRIEIDCCILPFLTLFFDLININFGMAR